MTAAEITLLYETEEEYHALAEARAIFSQMGISFRDEAIPSMPSLGHLQGLVSRLTGAVCLWAAGRSAYLLPVLTPTFGPHYPLIVLPCPTASAPQLYLDTLLGVLRGLPVTFTLPHDARGAALLAVQWLATRHTSYADLLQAFLHKHTPQPA